MDKQIKQIINAHKYRQNAKVFVGNLNPETGDQELRLNFDRFGKIVSIDRRADGDYMLVEYEEPESADKAISEMDKIVIDDCSL